MNDSEWPYGVFRTAYGLRETRGLGVQVGGDGPASRPVRGCRKRARGGTEQSRATRGKSIHPVVKLETSISRRHTQ